jgi:hypothetical protein
MTLEALRQKTDEDPPDADAVAQIRMIAAEDTVLDRLDLGDKKLE